MLMQKEIKKSRKTGKKQRPWPAERKRDGRVKKTKKKQQSKKHRMCKMNHHCGTSLFYETSHYCLFKHHFFWEQNTCSM